MTKLVENLSFFLGIYQLSFFIDLINTPITNILSLHSLKLSFPLV